MSDDYREPDESAYPRKGKRWSHRTRSYRDLAKADEDDRLERVEAAEWRAEQERLCAAMREIEGGDDRHIGPP
jgi:hypothetical protein